MSDKKKPYVKPEVTRELELETRAGSPFDPCINCDPEPPCGNPLD